MPKYFINPFAVGGDIVSIPDTTQLSGSVSYQTGWGPDYQKNLATDPTAKAVPRAQTNQLMLDITTNLQWWQQKAFPAFITSSDNGGTPFSYSQNAIVISGGVIYVSLVNSNTTTPPSSSWAVFSPSVSTVPVGAVIDFAMPSAPTNYLLCDGSIISRITYATLFSVIGTTWGAGDGFSSFQLPALQRCFRMGAGGTATGVIGNTVGSYGGEEAHPMTLSELIGHHHAAGSGMQFRVDVGTGGTLDATGGTKEVLVSNTADTGGSTPFNIISPAAVMYSCIKYQ